MSKSDLGSGTRWFEEIEKNLVDSSYGIVVVTHENQARPWLLFETGALAAKVTKPRVTPILVDLAKADLSGPLAQFQTTSLEHSELRKLLGKLNALRADENQKLDDGTFDKTFEKWWPDLSAQFEVARKKHASSPVPHPSRQAAEIATDVLTEVRTLSRQIEAQSGNLASLRSSVAVVAAAVDAQNNFRLFTALANAGSTGTTLGLLGGVPTVTQGPAATHAATAPPRGVSPALWNALAKATKTNLPTNEKPNEEEK